MTVRGPLPASGKGRGRCPQRTEETQARHGVQLLLLRLRPSLRHCKRPVVVEDVAISEAHRSSLRSFRLSEHPG